MTNCWKRNPSARSETLRFDLVDFATSVVELIRPNPRGFDYEDVKIPIKRVLKETDKQGWFVNVWDVEFVEPGHSSCSRASARVINNSMLDSGRVSRLKLSHVLKVSLSEHFLQSFELWNKMHWCRTLQHPNIACLMGISDALPSVKTALVFNVGPCAELVMNYLRRHDKVPELNIVG